jgi:hypothetical protein
MTQLNKKNANDETNIGTTPEKQKEVVLGGQTRAGANAEETVLSSFKQNLHKKMKISPEAFFRICDIEY